MRSLFTRYVTTMTSLIVIAALVILMSMTVSIQISNGAEYRADLEQSINSVQLILNAYGTNEPSQDGIFASMDSIIPHSNSELILLGTDGTVIYTSDRQADRIGFAVSSEYYGTAATGDVGGLFTKPCIYSCKKLYKANGQLYGVIIAYNPSIPGGELGSMSFNTVLVATIWLIIFSMTIIFALTESTTKDLRRIASVAEEFSKGNFKSRLAIPRNKELQSVAIAINEMADTLGDMEMSRTSLVANISHDLRTPMTIIYGYVNNMLDGAIAPEDYRHYLEIIASEIKRLSRLVSTLLDVSRLEAGKTNMNLTEFCLSETARIVLISCEERINAKHIDIEFDNQKELYVSADIDAVHKCIFNLLDNAIKFVPEKGKISIRLTETVIDGKPKAVYSITNNGDIIPSDEMPHLFERFYKSDRSRGLDKTGTGLGLYIVKTTLNALGEDITCTSSAAVGTTFTFTLPKTKSV